MENEKISIIVPFYNAEKYIEKCIENLLKQSYENFEIVLVNDNSDDNSEKIVKKYLSNDKIKYFVAEKTTIGNSYARNLGIEKSTGKYFIFVDVDDFIAENLLQILSEYIKQDYDLVKYKLQIVREGNVENEKISGPIFKEKNGEEAFNLLCFDDVMFDSPCLYLISKKIIQNNNFKFKENSYHEDFGLIPKIVLKANKVASINVYGYYYIQSNSSIMRNSDYEKKIKKAFDKLELYDDMVKFLDNENFLNLTKENALIYYTNSIFLNLEGMKSEDKKEYKTQIEKRKLKNNIKARNFKQFVKRLLLIINLDLYLKLRK